MKRAIVAISASIFLAACRGTPPEVIPTANVRADGKADVIDRYLECDRRALLGVETKDAQKALAGDGPMAVAIGNAFAEANQLSEARFWYQVAAENGSAIGMNNFAILVRDFDCHRANYWLAKAIKSGGIADPALSDKMASLEYYEANCR